MPETKPRRNGQTAGEHGDLTGGPFGNSFRLPRCWLKPAGQTTRNADFSRQLLRLTLRRNEWRRLTPKGGVPSHSER
jgi:hypothetical protein